MSKTRVAIIGAGPSGFGVAEVLRSKENKKHFNITMYERNGYVGGKCCTVSINGKVTNGRSHGYEAGAVLVSKHMHSYADLIKLLEKYDLDTEVFNSYGQPMTTYFKRGKQLPVKQFYLRQILVKPKKLLRGFKSFDKYVYNYLYYLPGKHAGYTNRPRALNRNFSKIYTRSVYTRLSAVIQGYGYADLDDRHLTPPALYYDQYLELGDVEFPLHTVNVGTQGIWAKIASTYPADIIRLNTEVKRIERKPEKVTIITDHGSEDYDYLFVATPIKPAVKYLDLGAQEKVFLSRMKHNHYVSILGRTEGLATLGTFNIDNCTDNKKIGRVLGGYRRYPESDMTVLYMYLPENSRLNDEQIINKAVKSLNEDFNAQLLEPQKAKVFHWDDYFEHLNTKDLNKGWYDNFEEYFQAKNRTYFVGGGLHMETMGAAVQYATEETQKFVSAIS